MDSAEQVPNEPAQAHHAHGTKALERPTIKQLGVTVLHDPSAGSEVVADLCFVHGLMGHPERTWSFGKLAKPKDVKPGLMARLKSNMKKNEKEEKEEDKNNTKSELSDLQARSSSIDSEQTSVEKIKSNCYWPLDLLPNDFPNLRIMTYGYDSHPSHFYKHKTTQLTITQHSLDLLTKITNIRAGFRKRPLIFVAHSLGGIVVKDMISESDKHQHQPSLKDAADSLRAIIFFGTPHLGASAAEWGQMLTNFASVVGISTYKGVLRGLSPDSEKLSGVNRDFDGILEGGIRGSRKLIYIYSFQEGRPFSSLKFFDGKIVPDTSSFFNRRSIERVSMIQDADHMNMCKLRTINDAAYVDFKAALQDYLMAIGNNRTTATVDQAVRGASQEPDLLHSLDFAGRLVRSHQIDQIRTSEETFEWVWKSEFNVWLRNDQPIFWICGNPASGKSTLMNHFMWNKRTQRSLDVSNDREWTLVYHFFDYRSGEDTPNNYQGFLQSVLIQILHAIPPLRDRANSQFQRKMRSTQHSSWSSSDLENLLALILSADELYLCLFLDGLDEYGRSRIELIDFLRRLGSAKRKICVASRPDPPLLAAFGDFPHFKMHIVNQGGIEAFVTRAMASFSMYESLEQHMAVQQLMHDIIQRAQGVFLWARLAAFDIIEGLSAGEDIGSVRKRLDDIPPELSGVYKRILRRRNKTQKFTLLRMLKLVTGAFYFLTVKELYQAMGFTLETGVNVDHWMDKYDRQSFEKQINAVSGSLLEITITQADYYKGGIGLVRTMHRTVQTFLEEDGWSVLELNTASPGLADEMWLHVCVEAIKRCRLANLCQDDVDFALRRANIRFDPFQQSSSSHLSEGDISELHPIKSRSDLTRFKTRESTTAIRNYALAYLLDHAQRFEKMSNQSSYSRIRPVISKAAFPRAHDLAWRDGTCKKCRPFDTISVDYRLAQFGSLPAITIQHGLLHLIREVLQIDAFWTKMTNAMSDHRTDKDTKTMSAAKIVAVDAACHLSDNSYGDILQALLSIDSALDDKEFGELIAQGPARTVKIVLGTRPVGPMQIQFAGNLRFSFNSLVGPLFFISQRSRCDTETEEILDLLIAHGEDIQGRCYPGGTVLHSCVEKISTSEETPSIIDLLVSRGANVNADGPAGKPLESCWRNVNERTVKAKHVYENGQIVRCLIKHGAVNHLADPNGLVPSPERMAEWGTLDWDDWFGRSKQLARARRYYYEGPKKKSVESKSVMQ